MRIVFDEDAMTEPERALVRLLCDVATIDALRWLPTSDERRAQLEAVADAINRVMPRARARIST